MHSRLQTSAYRRAHPAWAMFAGVLIEALTLTGASRAQAPPAKAIADAPAPNADLLHKLKTIIIPRLEFREASVRHALVYIQKRSVELDPAKVGVKIVFEVDPALVLDATSPFGSVDPESARLTMALANIPLIEALKYVTGLANLKFKLKDGAVVVVSQDAPEEIIAREWKVTPAMLTALDNKVGNELKELFAASGVNFPPGATVTLSADRSRLLINNTEENLDLLDALLRAPGADDPETPQRVSLKEIQRKLRTIVIPQLELREATVREAIEFLKRQSIELDNAEPRKPRGINIVLKLDRAAPPTIPGLEPLSPVPVIPSLEAVPPQRPTLEIKEPRITVSLTNISLGEAFRHIASLANLEFEVEPYCVALVPIREGNKPRSEMPVQPPGARKPR